MVSSTLAKAKLDMMQTGALEMLLNNLYVLSSEANLQYNATVYIDRAS